MYYVSLPDGRRLSFYLAAEEYVAHHMALDDDAWMQWQVGPSVICGRNQVIEAEVDTDYCRRHDIAIFRRKSGGGCVYADRGNVMLTLIARSDNVAFTYHRFVMMLEMLLRECGVEAHHSGRNDILVGDRKVCGTAFYLKPPYSIVHSTMLFDADMQNMARAITPTQDKLARHGVQSVSQRITLLKHHTDVTTAQFMDMARKRLCQKELHLSPDDIAAIETAELDYIIE